ncbi:MAG TPA: hypothetical protein VH092_18990 [Urbifossiella sp.]|nr:hypothetical protein [Urbifossiella sp.]
MPTIKKYDHYNLNNHWIDLVKAQAVQGFELPDFDQTDTLYVLKSKADKHTATAWDTDPHQSGHVQSWVILEGLAQAEWFWSVILASFISIAKYRMSADRMKRAWLEIHFDANDIQELVKIGLGAKKRVGNNDSVIVPFTKVALGANVDSDDNGYYFVFDHGPIT